MSEKHAYLIMAHNDFYILEKLLLLLDHENNDIYIHIDKKVKEFNFLYYQSICKKSEVIFIDRVDCRWGDFSLIQCELQLISEAISGKYKYYHLISGADLPLKEQDEIHNFFKVNEGLEFIHFSNDEDTKRSKGKVDKYHLFTRYQRHKNRVIVISQKIINKIGIKIQEFLKINRVRDYEMKFGAQWFSITHELAQYVVSQEPWIYERFKLTKCADEIFLQSIVYNSKFKDKVFDKGMEGDYFGCVRYIDWSRGNPYTFKVVDFQDLIESKYLFARKFSTQVDVEIIDKIFDKLIK